MNNRRYEQRVMLAMVAYMVVLFAANSTLHAASSLLLKVVLTLVPVVPVLYTIALMWWRIRDSDELEQRTNLVALGVAAALVSALSLVGGFLAAGGVVRLGGEVLIWVFPALMLGYGVAYKVVARRYGVDSVCTEDGSAWLPWYFAGTGLLMLVFALNLWRRHDTVAAVAMVATAGFFMVMSAWVWRRRADARRRALEDRP
ncbi:hypothetical protein ABQJ54_09435 [Rhodanobacter sp. Si-c]|uniref:Uncharacterized protein n=1 Tax=Rhodanobacter lycopersici TaxID=3162487 RepID=A0ABV3QES3_9GAMM